MGTQRQSFEKWTVLGPNDLKTYTEIILEMLLIFPLTYINNVIEY